MHHTAGGVRLLEVQEPPGAVGRVDECPLVGAVDVGAALLQHHALLVGAIDVVRTEHRLPALADTALGDDEVIPAITLQEFCAFGYRSSIDRDAIVEQTLAVG